MGYSACCDGILLPLKQTPPPVASRLSSPPPREQRGSVRTPPVPRDHHNHGPRGWWSPRLCLQAPLQPSRKRPPHRAGVGLLLLQAEVPQQLCKPNSRPFPPAPPTPQSPRPAVKEGTQEPSLAETGDEPLPRSAPSLLLCRVSRRLQPLRGPPAVGSWKCRACERCHSCVASGTTWETTWLGQTFRLRPRRARRTSR